MPPYAFDLQFMQHSPASQQGFLNLQHVLPAWIYRFDLVNLTQHTIDVVDISVESRGQMAFLAVSNANNLLYESPDDNAPAQQLTITPPTKRIVASFTPLINAHSVTVTIAIYTEARPDINDLLVTARCTDGNFIQITPDAYNAIGWEHRQ